MNWYIINIKQFLISKLIAVLNAFAALSAKFHSAECEKIVFLILKTPAKNDLKIPSAFVICKFSYDYLTKLSIETNSLDPDQTLIRGYPVCWKGFWDISADKFWLWLWHLKLCESLDVCCGVCHQQLLQRTSPKLLAGFWPNLTGMNRIWPSLIIVKKCFLSVANLGNIGLK